MTSHDTDPAGLPTDDLDREILALAARLAQLAAIKATRKDQGPKWVNAQRLVEDGVADSTRTANRMLAAWSRAAGIDKRIGKFRVIPRELYQREISKERV